MIQKLPRKEEGDQSWHRELVSPALSWAAWGKSLALTYSYCWSLRNWINWGSVQTGLQGSENEGVLGTSEPWPVSFCHGSQQLSCICWRTLVRGALGTVWSEGFCSEPRSWQCKVVLSIAGHFHSSYVLIWKCAFYKGYFPFSKSTLIGGIFPPPSKKPRMTHRIKLLTLDMFFAEETVDEFWLPFSILLWIMPMFLALIVIFPTCPLWGQRESWGQEISRARVLRAAQILQGSTAGLIEVLQLNILELHCSLYHRTPAD